MNMKKLLSLFLVLVMLLSLVACSSGSLEQELQELEDLLGAYEDLGQEEYEFPDGSPETQGDSESASNSDPTEEETEYSDDSIVVYTTDSTVSEETETSEETDPTETAPVETEENELPMDYFDTESTTPAVEAPAIDENGTYTSKEDVALYLYTYGKLPDNFITKKEAQALGWPGGNLEPYAPGKCIGGDRFGNYEGLLPSNHKYTECDIDTLGAKSRGAKRIVFSNDCSLIYYTDDHYESFTLLYGEE